MYTDLVTALQLIVSDYGEISWKWAHWVIHSITEFHRIYRKLYNELCKTRVLIGLEECVIRV